MKAYKEHDKCHVHLILTETGPQSYAKQNEREGERERDSVGDTQQTGKSARASERAYGVKQNDDKKIISAK